MTEKNSKRKFNLVTKVNMAEYQNILSCFDSSGYTTVGHFFRDALLEQCNKQSSPTINIPEINRETSNDLKEALKDLNALIDHFDALQSEDQSENYKAYINSSMEFVRRVAQASVTWAELFKGNIKNKKVMMNLSV